MGYQVCTLNRLFLNVYRLCKQCLCVPGTSKKEGLLSGFIWVTIYVANWMWSVVCDMWIDTWRLSITDGHCIKIPLYYKWYPLLAMAL